MTIRRSGGTSSLRIHHCTTQRLLLPKDATELSIFFYEVNTPVGQSQCKVFAGDHVTKAPTKRLTWCNSQIHLPRPTYMQG